MIDQLFTSVATVTCLQFSLSSWKVLKLSSATVNRKCLLIAEGSEQVHRPLGMVMDIQHSLQKFSITVQSVC